VVGLELTLGLTFSVGVNVRVRVFEFKLVLEHWSSLHSTNLLNINNGYINKPIDHLAPG